MAMSARPMPYQNACQRRSRSNLKKMLGWRILPYLRSRSGRRLAIALVVDAEHLVQAGLLRAQVDHSMAAHLLEHGVQVLPHLQAQGGVARFQQRHAGQLEFSGTDRV